jgi:acetyltransferase-like isoleucine patch superfamily enzyme
VIEDFCIIGVPFKGSEGLETVIGNNAVIRAGTYIYAGNIIGDNFQTGNKANIREKNQIGHNVSIGTLSVIEHHVIIEDKVRIHTQAFIPEYSHLKTGCWIGPNVVFTNARVPMSPDAKSNLKGPTIEPHAIIGANSTLLPEVKVGTHALIGAGSLVTKDITPHTIAFGHPASDKRKRE